MLRKSLVMLAVLSLAQFTYADKLPDDCEAAVDAADRLNTDNNKHCDYSKTGLNGVLHKAFANREGAREVTAKEVAPAQSAIAKAAVDLPRALTREFDSAAQLGIARYELLQLASKECAAGFILLDERYLPAGDKLLKLELNYRCL